MTSEIVHNDEQLRELTVMNRVSDKDMRAVATAENPFEAALALAADIYGGVIDASTELGNGFTLVEKIDLTGERMVLLHWQFNEGDHGEFASIAAVTGSQKRIIFNDGSSGVYAQLREFTQEHKRSGGMLAPRGLRANTYDTCPEKKGGCGRAMGKTLTECKNCGWEGEARGSATTYYIDVSGE